MKSKYLEISDIRSLQIEVTSRCNLMCPQCARVHDGKLNPLLSLSELTPEDYDKIFFEEKIPSLQEVLFNGNFGDPVISKHIDYAIEILLQKGIAIKIFTNGSLRKASWWKNLGQLFANTKNEIVFSIDGLKDTNFIYRVNSKWDKIMENVSAYLSSGAKARWDFLIFKHNEHQVEEAKTLAKKMGFKTFLKKKTKRFVTEEKNLNVKFEPIYNKKGQFIKNLDKTSNSKKDVFEIILKKYGSFENYINKTPIHCKYKKDMKGLYIDFMSCVWPCCWLGFERYMPIKSKGKRQLNLLIEKYGKNFNSLRHLSLSEILSHDWFNKQLVESWKNKTTDENFKFFTCGKFCGKEYEKTSGPNYKNSEKIDLN
ncbi:MAG: hypothetical protein GDA46_01300 [Bdellovibrionales bacterium]|nr:hypothetical protein [Bdellovibrionales bacterium]